MNAISHCRVKRPANYRVRLYAACTPTTLQNLLETSGSKKKEKSIYANSTGCFFTFTYFREKLSQKI